MFFNSNTIFMGIPINLALFGEDSLPYVLIYYVANTMFFWTFGVYEISLDNKKLKAKNSIRKTLKNIFSPALLGFAQSFNVESFPRNIFFIQAAMPVMTNTAIIAEAYEVDGDYAALMIALTTVGSLIMIPLYIFFLTYIIN